MKNVLLLWLLTVSPDVFAKSDEAEAGIEGRWRMEEKSLVLVISQAADGTWSGVASESPRKSELGKKIFQKLVYKGKERHFSGMLLMPENDSTHDVVVTVEGDAMKAVVGKSFFSKTLVLRRQK